MNTVIHATAGYFFLLLTVRILARRPGAQMTPFEFVIVFLMGGVIILATVGDDHSETNAICAVLTVGLLHRSIGYLKSRYPAVASITDGKPQVLLQDGRWQMEMMNKMRLQDTDVMASARTKGVKDLDGIKYAVLERNGAISIFKKEED